MTDTLLETSTVRRHFVLHSGGLDSSTALLMCCDQNPDDQVIAVSVHYGQRHKREIELSKALCSSRSIRHLTVDMAQPPKSMLTDPSKRVPEISYSDITGMSPTYVPFRNGQLLSRIAGIAQGWVMEGDIQDPATREATIWFGAHAEDAHNWAYPDCTPEFVGAMANAIYIGTYHRVRLITPFLFWKKSSIVLEGEVLGLPFELTWSCYKGEEKQCGVCMTCQARKGAFRDAAILDPTEYAR